jgi:hypothetical protein
LDPFSFIGWAKPSDLLRIDHCQYVTASESLFAQVFRKCYKLKKQAREAMIMAKSVVVYTQTG